MNSGSTVKLESIFHDCFGNSLCVKTHTQYTSKQAVVMVTWSVLFERSSRTGAVMENCEVRAYDKAQVYSTMQIAESDLTLLKTVLIIKEHSINQRHPIVQLDICSWKRNYHL